MFVDATRPPVSAPKPEFYAATAKYGRSSTVKAVWQLANTLIPYAGLWALMIRLVQGGAPYWITLALSVVASGFLVRLFILFHDCCHGAFFNSRRANSIIGNLLGILAFTPFAEWRRQHSIHHATAGDLDRRGTGDIPTLTVEEYRAASQWGKLAYRLTRNPYLMCLVGPTFVFLIIPRFPYRGARKRERVGVMLTNLGIAAMVGAFSLGIGFRAYLAIQLPVILIAGAAGVWLFYIQHQFEGVYWARHQTWDLIRVAMQGSSYYKLPKVLQWFTASIGLHHIHHLRPRIPNYNLQRCYDEFPVLQAIKPVTLRGSLKSLRLNLWDERQGKLVSFRSLKADPAAG